jgi:2-succinyl-5-enolpyruvyl-6-hydroxy-3-cyclohexene-1-carboxylate synthase
MSTDHTLSTALSDKSAVQDFLALSKCHEIKHVILCPGSRNAPFSISLFHDKRFNTHIIPDERSAAFFALGMAQQQQQPVVLICTSGTASLNFSPAIAEAFYQRVPLLIVTADRPIEWIDQGEGQSIRQLNVFQNFVKASFEIQEEAVHPDIVWYNNRIMDEAMRLTNQGVAGPVHINFPLREPLYKTSNERTYQVKTVERIAAPQGLDPTTAQIITSQLEYCNRVLILAGQHPKHEALNTALECWAQEDNVFILTEAHSNLASERWCSTIDRTITGLSEFQLQSLYPEIIITFGHNIISRKVKDWLRKNKCDHWHIDTSGEGLDTLKQLQRIIPMDPASFFQTVQPKCGAKSNYAASFRALHEQRKTASQQYLTQMPWCDLKAFYHIYQHIPSNYELQMGNSSVVRYILLQDARPDIAHNGNRGVAGIDGCTSTAIGAAWASQSETVLISGDIAFFYDSNAFWNDYVSKKLKIVVINNQGGGIFRIIDGPASSAARDQYFETTHQRSAQGLAQMYSLPFKQCDQIDTLESSLNWLWSSDQCAILEIITPRETNDLELKKYFNYISK